MNSVVLVGRLTKDPDFRYTPNGNGVVKFTLAVKGFTKDDVDFITCEAWKKTAENVANFCRKGQQVAVKGSLKIRVTDNPGGGRTYFTVVICDEVKFLEAAKPQEEVGQVEIVENNFGTTI
jgi:single-strand DNA-binding protein